MGTGIDPKVDYAFKRVFGSEENTNVLQHMLNAFLKDSLPNPITEVTLLNPFCLTDVIDDKLSILDIKARDQLGREYIIEVQLFAHANFPERLLYYGAKEYSAQLREGEDYSELRPVIVVCFVNADLFKAARDYYSSFELIDSRQRVRFSDHLQFQIVELPKFLQTLNDLRDDRDRWTYFMRHGDEFDIQTLPPALAEVSEIQQATGTLTMVSQSPAERAQYEAKLKFDRDRNAQLQFALDEGNRIGRLEGQSAQARAMVLRIGRHQFGEPSEAIVAELEAIKSVERLEQLADEILDCKSWDALNLDASGNS